jgi:nicotinate-nucleotide adenylyltransferase
MRTGILGGTFDPVHFGHLGIARAAMGFAGLDRVLLLPCASPPHKQRRDLTDGYRRFAMLTLATQDSPDLLASPHELLRGGTSYTVDTLEGLASELPGDEIFLILGSDSFVELETWRSFREIVRRAALLVVPRPGVEAEEIARRAPEALTAILLPRGAPLPAPSAGALPFAAVVEAVSVDISSTDIRTRAREGRPITGLVTAPVETYIRRQGLYGSTVNA